jgi:glycosyltransferase involved in cell wall biosynthesis
MARSIQKIIDNPELRQRLVQDGFRQARRYDWEKAAGETLSVLEQVAHRTNSIS